MTEPTGLPSATTRYSLPLIFPGQAQKEFFLNGALERCDALLHMAIRGETDAAPDAPTHGEAWLVGPEATGDFTGREGAIATRQQDRWVFVEPRDGLRVMDLSTAQELLFLEGWRREEPIELPEGGGVVDAEARAAISAIVAVLQRTGTLPSI